MKTINLKFITYLFLFLFTACKNISRAIYIQSIQIDSIKRIDWYVYSYISGFSDGIITISNDGHSSFLFKSQWITSIKIASDTLEIQLYVNKYQLDSTEILKNRLIIKIDTTGGMIDNLGPNRVPRLFKKHVDYYKPHFVDTYCPTYDCP